MSTPSNLSKFAGLQLIDRYSLPHPDWRFGTSPEDIPEDPWTTAAHGWTVRCAPKSRYAFALPASHRLPYRQVRVVLESLRQLTSEHVFVVYPSWEFDISGGLLIDRPMIYVEVVRGDIADLLRGRRSPDAVLSFDSSAGYASECLRGDAEILHEADQVVLVRALRALREEDKVVFEWTKTTDGQILFHDCARFGQ